MIFQRKISSFSKTIINLIRLNQPYKLQRPFNYGQSLSQLNYLKVQKLNFSTQKKNTVPSSNLEKNDKQLQEIKEKIETMYFKLNQHQQLKELEKIIYPEALLHGQEDICKLSKLYDLLIERFERENIRPQNVQHLIKAGDFYRMMTVRRLKALKPYKQAKHLMQSQDLHKTQAGAKTYKQLCQKLQSLISQDIQKGQCSSVQQYYQKGLQQQRSGNQLQSLYYYHKGLCISEYREIPDKLLHFNLFAHYVFLSELMRPKCHQLKDSQHFRESLLKHQELQSIGEKWWKEEFSTIKDIDKRHSFEQTLIWAHANKGDIYYRAHMFQEAAKCYQKVIDYYKKSKTPDQRLKIINVIENLEKSYEHLGLNNKALSFLEWAHDFVKDQTLGNVILISRYLKPIDEMLIAGYEKCREWGNGENIKKRQDVIEKQLREIVS